MGKVDAFALTGVKCFFNSYDHGPAHFHALRDGAWEYRVFFLRAADRMLKEKWSKARLAKADRRGICEKAETHRVELLREWEQKVSQA
jgi:hypothetical protein